MKRNPYSLYGKHEGNIVGNFRYLGVDGWGGNFKVRIKELGQGACTWLVLFRIGRGGGYADR
jgi:hypothetical protein